MAQVIYAQRFVELSIVLFVLYRVVNLAIEAVTLMMFVRAILSWFPIIRLPNSIAGFLYNVTEFFISPVRTLLFKIDFVKRCPIDLSFLVTYILLHSLQGLLASIYYSVI